MGGLWTEGIPYGWRTRMTRAGITSSGRAALFGCGRRGAEESAIVSRDNVPPWEVQCGLGVCCGSVVSQPVPFEKPDLAHQLEGIRLAAELLKTLHMRFTALRVCVACLRCVSATNGGRYRGRCMLGRQTATAALSMPCCAVMCCNGVVMAQMLGRYVVVHAPERAHGHCNTHHQTDVRARAYID